MTHIIAEPCIGVKDTACVDVCPVDCIYGADEDWEMLYIHPEECIDCGSRRGRRDGNAVQGRFGIDDSIGPNGPKRLARFASTQPMTGHVKR